MHAKVLAKGLIRMARAAAVLAIAGTAQPAGAAEPVLELPLGVHLLDNVEVTHQGVGMTTWVTTRDVRTVVLPELNRIWRQARIRWRLKRVRRVRMRDGRRKGDFLSSVTEIERKSVDTVRRRWVRSLDRLGRVREADRDAFNVFVVPFLGNTIQGVALKKRPRAFVAAWTNRPTKGNGPPRRFKLVEAEPMETGSIARTLAHELGHLLGLGHEGCASSCLMGGNNGHGYNLSVGEIAVARSRAKAFIRDRRRSLRRESGDRSPRSGDRSSNR